jgi:hypothetical protein
MFITIILVAKFQLEFYGKIFGINYSPGYRPKLLKVEKSILSTLITCLPNQKYSYIEAKILSIPTSNPPLFNYTAFCKVLQLMRSFE